MSEPTTAAGRDWVAVLRAATLDPAVAKLIGDDGREQLVALVSIDGARDAAVAIEAEARAAALDEARAAVAATRRPLPVGNVDVTDGYELWLGAVTDTRVACVAAIDVLRGRESEEGA